MNQSEPQPKQVEQKQLDHKYEVQENGDVKVIQTQVLEFLWGSRDFLTLHRNNQRALEETKAAYAEANIQKLKDQEAKIAKEIEIMQPIVEESEKLTKINHEKLMKAGLLTQLKAAIADKEFKEQWWIQVWARMKEDRKTDAINELSAEEKNTLLKIMQKLKRKNLIK